MFNRFDADFANDAINVRFGLATDDLDTFSTDSAPYSCWSSLLCRITYNYLFV
jgi:hypothetical protein